MHILNAHISLYVHLLGGMRRGAKERVVLQLLPQTPHHVLLMPPGAPREPAGGPPGAPQRRADKAHIKQIMFHGFYICFTCLLHSFYMVYFIFTCLFTFFLRFCYVFPSPTSRFDREAPRGGPTGGPWRRPKRRHPEEAPQGRRRTWR